ncbi:E3 ubiquitin/ISG15 ligase TRIM25 [Indicator indicator]|uniref:E3 ubiquitin/ISG15 ligase TRIM25 n=1 Tax=Indicator indicator TaxID=1002788 RepID=UPI0023DEB282|nr:E3 ubiquitin/ISG15 ligase TRIM25 [Indicator indicator]
MASVLEPSLEGLEEELTCSICLCLFSSPVTIPCGHNFCSSCLELTWAGLSGSFSCPQCRTTFKSRPQLQKNTVLCKVVEQLQGRSGAGKQEEEEEEEEAAAGRGVEEAPIFCDSCLQAPAVQTCLTCTASFCAEHLRPHQDSPAFRAHQLCPPLRDLQQRKCQKHDKLFEFFCSQHGSCICSLCLLEHKLCHTSPLEVAKTNAELVLKKKLVELHNQSERTAQLITRVKTNQNQAAETASRKRDLIRTEFSEIKALIEEKENNTLKVIADEEKKVCNKFDYVCGILGNKKKEIQSLTDQIEMALTEGDDVLFLKRATALQRTSTKDAYVPTIEMDQNLMHSTYQAAINLKDIVKQSVPQCKERKKVETNPPPVKAKPAPAAAASKTAGKKAHKVLQQAQGTSQVEANTKEKKKAPKVAPTTGTPSATAAVSNKELMESFMKKPREELLQYAANITLDFNTAHNKVVLSDKYTKMAVSDTPMSYGYHPQRFMDCPQVLGFQCFKRGIHYWEVEMQQNNFCGIGICYGSMDRQGPESRLGRNSSSWCIEWFNSKISSWHDDVEKCLPNVKATKIGVLLHCEGGFVLFLAVGEKHNVIYKFKSQFTEALYPAFWLFSSGTVLSLSAMKQ